MKKCVEKIKEQMKEHDASFLHGFVVGLSMRKYFSEEELQEIEKFGEELQNKKYEEIISAFQKIEKRAEWLREMNRLEKLRSQDIARRPFINYITGEPEYKW